MNKTHIALISLLLLIMCSPENSVNEFEQWKRQYRSLDVTK